MRGHPWGSHTAFCSHCLLQPAATSLRQLELDIHRRETKTAFLGIPNDACSTRQHSPENVPQDLQFSMAIDSHPSYTCTHGLDFNAAPEGDGVKMLQEAMQSSLHAHPRNTSFRHVRICAFNTKKPSAPSGTLHPLPRLDAPEPLCIIMQNPQRRHGLREQHTKARRACYGSQTEGVQAGTEKPEQRMKKAKSTGLNFRDQSLRYEMMQVTHLN